MVKKEYVYPQLPGHDFCLFRTMGSGLANCLFVYAKAIAYAHRTGARLISPTWFNIGIGPYIRHQKDKRHYLGLFTTKGEISGVDKIYRLLLNRNRINVICGLENYFGDILNDSKVIASYIEAHVNPSLLENLNKYDFTNCVAVHIRLGDYPERVRIPISWYANKIKTIQAKHPEYRFLVFSDGRDNELIELTSIRNVERQFFGNAIADILAISKCCYLIGSDSTFSGWGAFLGQVPCIFLRKHFGPVLQDRTKEIIEEATNLWI